ncbi:MAG: hypothetical protein WBB67_09160 [bacterium]
MKRWLNGISSCGSVGERWGQISTLDMITRAISSHYLRNGTGEGRLRDIRIEAYVEECIVKKKDKI